MIDEIVRGLICFVGVVVVVLGSRWDSSGWILEILGIGILGSRGLLEVCACPRDPRDPS